MIRRLTISFSVTGFSGVLLGALLLVGCGGAHEDEGDSGPGEVITTETAATESSADLVGVGDSVTAEADGPVTSVRLVSIEPTLEGLEEGATDPYALAATFEVSTAKPVDLYDLAFLLVPDEDTGFDYHRNIGYDRFTADMERLSNPGTVDTVVFYYHVLTQSGLEDLSGRMLWSPTSTPGSIEQLRLLPGWRF